MIGHISIGVRDIARTKRFYDAVLGPIGYTCLSEGEGSLGYGGQNVVFWIGATDHPVPACGRSMIDSTIVRSYQHSAAPKKSRRRSSHWEKQRRLEYQNPRWTNPLRGSRVT